MTVKVVVLYTQPNDPDAFEGHYLGTHMPLAQGMPGLLRAETGRFAAALDGGEQPFYRMAELVFSDEAAMNAAFGSPEGQATAADFGTIAPPGSRLLIQSVDD